MTASDPRVGEIQARLDAATPATWAWDGHVRRGLVSMRQATPILQCAALLYPAKPDAEFIAAAPDDVAYLLAELRDRDEKLAKVNALHQRVEGYIFGAIPGAEPDYPVCSMCFTEDERPEPWPCATAAAVAAAKGGGE